MNGRRATAGALTAVVVNHNGHDCLETTLRALLTGTHASDFEIIVVDSASTDGSWQIAATMDPRIRVLRFAENVGFCRGCNLGARDARGEYVAFVNFDGAVETGWDRALLQELQPGISVVGGMLLTADGEEIEAVGLGLAPIMSTFGLLEGTPRTTAPACPMRVCAVSGALMMVRRDEFLAVGGFNEDLWMYGDEIDLCLRLGGDVVVTPHAAIRHEMGHAAGPALSPLRVHWSSRNRLINAARHLPLRHALLSVVASALYDVVTIAGSRRSDIARAALSGWASGLPRMHRERHVRTKAQREAAAAAVTPFGEAIRQYRQVRDRRSRISG